MLSLFSRLEFQSIVDRYQGDYRVRTLTCWDQFIFLLFGQFSKRDSLRDTIDTMNSQSKKFYHLGTTHVFKSTLSDANNSRDYRIYQSLYFKILHRVQAIAPKHKLKLNRKFYILDSTTIDLCLKLFPWARFRKNKAAVKLHTLLDADGSLPPFLEITDGKVHDSTIAKKADIPKNIRFVTRKKTNAKYQVLETLKVNESQGVMSDEIVIFTGYQTHKKYPHPLRIIRFLDGETDKELEFLTNDLKLDALTITQINLFERKPITEVVFNIKYKPPSKNDNSQFSLFSTLTGH